MFIELYRNRLRWPLPFEVLMDLTVLSVPDAPAARGAAIGRALGGEIKGLWDRWTGGDAAVESRYFAYAAMVWPKICEFAPESAVEIDALARASKLPRVLLVALNSYDELGLLPNTGKAVVKETPIAGGKGALLDFLEAECKPFALT